MAPMMTMTILCRRAPHTFMQLLLSQEGRATRQLGWLLLPAHEWPSRQEKLGHAALLR